MHLGLFLDSAEPFLARELLALQERGVPVTVMPCGQDISVPGPGEAVFRGGLSLDAAASAAQIIQNPAASLRTMLRARNLMSTARRELKAGYLARVVRRRGVSHLHGALSGEAAELAAMVSALTGIPFSFTAHGADLFIHNPGLRDKIRHATAVRATTEFAARELRERFPANASVIHCIRPAAGAVEEAASPPEAAAGPPFRIAAGGPFISRSGLDQAIEAACNLTRRGLEIDLVIAGTGPLAGDLLRHVELRRAGGFIRIETPGDYARALAGAAVALAPCRRDRLGGIDPVPEFVLEAMRLGVPVVSTRLPGVDELIEDSRTGRLLEPDNAHELAEAAAELLADPLLRQLLAQAARRDLAKRHDSGRQAGLLLGLYSMQPQPGAGGST